MTGEPEHTADRHETSAERLDRNWADLLQETRVTQTGVQFIAGFLLTLPFQSRFSELEQRQVAVYLALVLLAGLTVGITLTPISVHRRLFGKHVKERLVHSAHRVMQAVLACVASLVAGIVFFVFDVVVGLVAGLIAGGGLALTFLVLLLLLPQWVDRDQERPETGT